MDGNTEVGPQIATEKINSISWKQILFFTLIFAFEIFIFYVVPKQSSNVIIYSYLNSALLLFLFFSIVITLFPKIRIYCFQSINLKPLRQLSSYISIAILLMITVFLSYILSKIQVINYISGDIKIIPRSISNIIIYGINISIFAPIWEELYFRGILFQKLTQKFPLIFSAILSSVIFSLVHTNTTIAHHITIFIIGIFLALLYKRTGSLAVPILLHSLINIVSIFY
ncbi:hypothetical protein CN692_17040 [Bacillus sp. AFS002410]|uniref:CPBP family intramembrane glutamic endopeptidase n=1 Tax=Bacillus sp. AFS002410 TaxID=2033481 RepID=UPI000BEF8003|nr:type II CAAX endopeptidase family protein [Bacillus sp. AFS002410]PEJ56545.1 hypothetical protein CN692_17040 [Bacillus sp. AFS002410]